MNRKRRVEALFAVVAVPDRCPVLDPAYTVPNPFIVSRAAVSTETVPSSSIELESDAAQEASGGRR